MNAIDATTVEERVRLSSTAHHPTKVYPARPARPACAQQIVGRTPTTFAKYLTLIPDRTGRVLHRCAAPLLMEARIMTADAEAEGKVAGRRGRLSRRRASAHRVREQSEFGDTRGLDSTSSVPGEPLLSTWQRCARRSSSVPGISRGTADVRWCRSKPAARCGFRRLGAQRRGGASQPALAQTRSGCRGT